MFPFQFLIRFSTPILLTLGIALFFGFGWFHLGKFETVDEHFWKYDRIGDYFAGWKQGLKEGKWKKTRVNDKPGITVALVSGTGLLIEPNPESHRIRDPKQTENDFYTLYDTDRTERLNTAFRLPILLTNTLLLILFFFLGKRYFARSDTALFATLFLALSPIVIGISQVINPDALLWSFGGNALLAFLIFLKEFSFRFALLSGIFFGFVLLTKYTGNILLPAFLLLGMLFLFVRFETEYRDTEALQRTVKKIFAGLGIVFLSGIAVFSIFLPAAIENTKYLFSGTLDSPAMQAVRFPFFGLLLVIAFDLLLFRSQYLHHLLRFCSSKKPFLFGAIAIIPLLFILLSLTNVYGKEFLFPIDNIRESSVEEDSLAFPSFAEASIPIWFLKAMTVQFSMFVFSLPALSFLLFIGLLAWMIRSGKNTAPEFAIIFLFVSLFLPLYMAGGLLSDVLVNPRYSILLYPLLALALGAFVSLLSEKAHRYTPPLRTLFFGSFILFFGFFSLFSSKPFSLNFENALLPRHLTFADSWGYGAYEAAMYLNSLPNPETIEIWADRSGICQFIKGKCHRDHEIDPNHSPDYFVFSRRGSLRHPFEWDERKGVPNHPTTYYYEQGKTNPEWKLEINGRPDNFIVIVKSEEK